MMATSTQSSFHALFKRVGEPDCVGFFSLVASLIVHSVLLPSAVGASSSFDTTECLQDTDATFITRSTALFTAGLSGGALLVTWIFTANSPGMSRAASRSAMLTLAGCFVHFAFLGAGLSPSMCVRALGGSASLRPQEPLLIVFWATNAVAELCALPRLLPGKHPLSSLGMVWTIIANFGSGAVATFTEVFALWIVMLIVSCAANVMITFQLVSLLRTFRHQCKDRRANRVFEVIAPLCLALWTAFPICWMISQTSVLSPGVEQVCWIVLSLCTKLAIGVLLIFGGLQQVGRETSDMAMLVEIETHRKIAEGRDESKRLFLRYILHELRVPLQSAQLAVEELLLGLLSGELIASEAYAKAALQVATQRPSDCTRGADLITSFVEAGRTAAGSITTVGRTLDEFLSLSKIEDGRMRLEPTDLGVRGWLTESSSSFKSALGAKGHHLLVTIDHNVPEIVRADGNKLRQVLNNYLSNAIKFSPSGSDIAVNLQVVVRAPALVLHVSGETLRADSNVPSTTPSRIDHLQPLPFLRLSVTDRGPGIAPRELALLFQPYMQIRAGEMQKGMGTGLGLAFCKSITELAGGTVGATSSVGVGSIFWMEIPLLVPVVLQALTRPGVGPDASANSEASINLALRQAAPALSQTSALGQFLRFARGGDRIMPAPLALAQIGGVNDIGVLGSYSAPHNVSNAGGATVLAVATDAAVVVLDQAVLSRVVVVDDVHSNRMLFARLLQRGGAQIVFTAEHGLDCLGQLSKKLETRNSFGAECDSSPAGGTVPLTGIAGSADLSGPSNQQLTGADELVDAWFIDGNMPVMDGIELTRRLRKAGVRVPIIAVTGNALGEDQELFIEAGASTVLTKPCTAVKLELQLGLIGCRLPQAIIATNVVALVSPILSLGASAVLVPLQVSVAVALSLQEPVTLVPAQA